jgi:hypothetical protein
MKRLDLVQYPAEYGDTVFVILGLGHDGEADTALIAGIYNIVSEDHASIPNVMAYTRDLTVVEKRE